MEALTDIQTSALIIKSPINPAYQEILSNEALCFVEKLERHFRDTRQILLDNRISDISFISFIKLLFLSVFIT